MVKKVMIFILVLVFIVSIILMGISCKTGGTASNKGLIVYLAPLLNEDFNRISNNNIKMKAEELGFTFKTFDATNKIELQLEQVDTALELKPKVVVLTAVDVKGIITGVEKIKAKNIPVVVYDRIIEGTKIDMQSLCGTSEMGKLAAESSIKLLTEKYGSPKGKVLEIIGDLQDSWSVTFGEGFHSIIDASKDIKVISKAAEAWDTGSAVNIADDQLTTNPDIDLIFAHGDFFAQGIVPILQQKGYKPGQMLMVAGGGNAQGLEIIRSGWLQVDIGAPLIQQVDGVFTFMDQILSGKKLEAGNFTVGGLASRLEIMDYGPVLIIPGEVIDKNNVDDKGLWANQIKLK